MHTTKGGNSKKNTQAQGETELGLFHAGVCCAQHTHINIYIKYTCCSLQNYICIEEEEERTKKPAAPKVPVVVFDFELSRMGHNLAYVCCIKKDFLS